MSASLLQRAERDVRKEGMDTTESVSERSAIITARGTGEGLVLRVDGRVAEESLREALRDFLASRRTFLAGNDVALEWVGEEPPEEFVDGLAESLFKDFDMTIRSSRLRESGRMPHEGGSDEDPAMTLEELVEVELAPGPEYRRPAAKEPAVKERAAKERGVIGLFAGMEALGLEVEGEKPSERVKPGGDSAVWDEPDTRLVYSTVRSGQRVETEHSLVVCGDVNSGAEVIAGGDIIVLGALRGIAHAGAYEESGGGRFIFALNLQPTQLRIGSVITRGVGESTKGPEIAKVDGGTVVVEPYGPRSAFQRTGRR
jgi:septum formation inhibitor MinC